MKEFWLYFKKNIKQVFIDLKSKDREVRRKQIPNVLTLIRGVVAPLTIIPAVICRRINLAFILIAGIWWVNFVRAPVKSDQGTVFNLANAFSKEDYTGIEGKGYFYMHPLQFGCVLGMELIIKLIGNGEALTFQMING